MASHKLAHVGPRGQSGRQAAMGAATPLPSRSATHRCAAAASRTALAAPTLARDTLAVLPAAMATAPLLLLARYHRWATARLCGALTPAAHLYTADVGLPFRSVGATINHMAAAESLWWARVTGREAPGWQADELAGLWRGEPGDGQWARGAAAQSLAAGRDALLRLADEWRLVADSATPAALAADVVYTDTSGVSRAQTLGIVLHHVFNHATHHRGQVTAAVPRLNQLLASSSSVSVAAARATGAVVAQPELDLPAFVRDDEAAGAAAAAARRGCGVSDAGWARRVYVAAVRGSQLQ